MIKRVPVSEVYNLRLAVLRETDDIRSVQFVSDSLDGAFHLAFFTNNAVTTVASFSPESKEIIANKHFKQPYRLRGMATAVSFQGKGQGQAVIEFAEEEIKQNGGDAIWANARLSALGFYIKMGYKTTGENFMVKGIGPHVVVYKNLV